MVPYSRFHMGIKLPKMSHFPFRWYLAQPEPRFTRHAEQSAAKSVCLLSLQRRLSLTSGDSDHGPRESDHIRPDNQVRYLVVGSV